MFTVASMLNVIYPWSKKALSLNKLKVNKVESKKLPKTKLSIRMYNYFNLQRPSGKQPL